MSLDKAMLELADQIDADAEEVRDGEVDCGFKMLQSYARQIRSAVKASEGSVPPPSAALHHCRRCPAPVAEGSVLCVACQGDIEQRAKKLKERAKSEEAEDVRTAVILDGPMAEGGQSTSVPIPGDAQVGGSDINVGGHRYRLTIHGLRHVPSKTEILLGK